MQKRQSRPFARVAAAVVAAVTAELLAVVPPSPAGAVVVAGTVRLSVDSTGGQLTGRSILPDISSDGRFVAFQSSAANLVPGDTNGKSDIFVLDRTRDGIEIEVMIRNGEIWTGYPTNTPRNP